jgi:arylsulfatase A-like enzyme
VKVNHPLRYLRLILYIGYLALPTSLAAIILRIPPYEHLILELLFVAMAGYWLTVNSQRVCHPIIRFIVAFIPACLIFFFQFLELISYYLQGESFNERFFFHSNLATLRVGSRAYGWMVLVPIAVTVIAGGIDTRLCRKPAARKAGRSLISAWVLVLLAVIFLPNAPKNCVAEYLRITRSQMPGDMDAIKDELKKKHVNVEAFTQPGVKTALQSDPKNLIMIYLESLESSYLDEKQFPDLVPNIKRAMANGLAFTNLHQYSGADWTMAGMFASQCGMPLAVVTGNDSIYENRALKNIVGLGDVLNKAGYYQTYMGGCDLSFAGKGNFYSTHGYQEVLGYKELKAKVSDPSYETGWGLYDDTLFDMAAQRFNALSKQHEKINLTMLSLDTHHPHGDASRSCPAYAHSKNSMLQAVHCTDFLFGKFLESLKQGKNYDDTLIFVMSDHLAMENVAMPLYAKTERKLLAFALNAGITGKIDMRGAHFDIAPTILDLLHIQTDAVFPLGQSLLRREQPDRFALFQGNGYEQLNLFLKAAGDRRESIDICAKQGITGANMPDHTISIGGRRIVMSSGGYPTYPEDGIFIMRCTLDGQVQEYQIGTEADAANMVQASPDAVYFMLTHNAQIPFNLFPGRPDGNWRWYLGNPSSLDGATGEAPQFGQITLDSVQCRNVLSTVRQSSSQIFLIRKQVQRLHERVQAAQSEFATAYAHFCPAKVDLVSSGSANGESHIALGDMLLNAAKGITLVAVDASSNNVTHYRSYDVAEVPHLAETLSDTLNRLEKNRIAFIVTQGEVALPTPVIGALENLGAQHARRLGAGEPYILVAKVGERAVFEQTGELGTTISKTFFEYDDEGNAGIIKQLWNGSTITMQSASAGEGRSYVLIDNIEVPRIGRGFNVFILDAATKAVKLRADFDTYGDAGAAARLCETLQRAMRDDIVIVLANDTAAGGQSGDRIPESLEAVFKRLGAMSAGAIRFRTPYLFLTKVGSGLRIEKWSQTEGILHAELTPQEVRMLFPRSVHAPLPEFMPIQLGAAARRDAKQLVRQKN